MNRSIFFFIYSKYKWLEERFHIVFFRSTLLKNGLQSERNFRRKFAAIACALSLSISSLLCASWESSFPSEDPVFFHGVHVIEGTLHLAICDLTAEGAKSIPFIRRYASESSESSGQSGWQIFPQICLMIDPLSDGSGFFASAWDSNGSPLLYAGKSDLEKGSSLSPLHPNGSQLQIVPSEHTAKILSPDRGKKIYRKFNSPEAIEGHYLLAEEIRPDGNSSIYSYDDEGHLTAIEIKNPTKTKTWARLDIKASENALEAASNQASVSYSFLSCDRGSSLISVRNEPLEYDPLSGNLVSCKTPEGPLRISYFSNRMDLDLDRKVQSIEWEDPNHPGQSQSASFSYRANETDVRTPEGLLRRYRHDGSKLISIDYFDETDSLLRSERFFWDASRLRCRALCDGNGMAVFATTFSYDSIGNPIETAIWGNLTGEAPPLFSIEDSGRPTSAESFGKSYRYVPGSSLIQEESEEGGLIYRYEYLEGTNLLACKRTCSKDQTLLREFYFYDEDHFPILQIFDDGSAADPFDLSRVSTRLIRRFSFDPQSGLKIADAHSYFDPASYREIPLKTIRYTYSAPNHRLIRESVEDAKGTLRYWIDFSYDFAGCLIKKSDSLGRNLLAELPSQDSACAPKELLDAFGRCRQKMLPRMRDEEEKEHVPTISFSYDLMDNCIAQIPSDGSPSSTLYNIRRQPIEITDASGSVTEMYYDKAGCLKKQISPDRSAIHYFYDPFHRVLAKKFYSPSQSLIREELYSYSSLHLESVVDGQGSQVSYRYDSAGRKIEEISPDGRCSFSYDDLGFLKKASRGDISRIQLFDPLGQVLEEWVESPDGGKQHHVLFSYDAQGRKTVIQKTGGVKDLLSYDDKGRILKHIDSLGNATLFLYDETEKDEFGQPILKKTSIDPLGRKTIETYDASNRLSALEKTDAQGVILFRERRSYNPQGLLTKQSFARYRNGVYCKEQSVRFFYDKAGRLSKTVENDRKISETVCDSQGRLVKKTLPNGVELSYTYDALGRLAELQSSDGTVHYRYSYDQKDNPIAIEDLVSHLRLEQSFDASGRLIRETNGFGFAYSWEYDSLGRKSRFFLPDGSSIAYRYKGTCLASIERFDPSNRSLYRHSYLAFDVNGQPTEEESIFSGEILRTATDLLGRPIERTTPWLSERARYDAAGRICQTSDSLDGFAAYRYDDLDQLLEHSTGFDSLEHPMGASIGPCGELLSLPGLEQAFDANGCPIHRTLDGQSILYEYDALARLTAVIRPGEKKTSYLYDPLSRLLAKDSFAWENKQWVLLERKLYLYDQTAEIGTALADRSICELKIIGSGSKRDIGSAIALEIDGAPFLPLHDFSGNIIGLVGSDRRLQRFQRIDPFGKTSSPNIAPWSFCSKRVEDDMAFFGRRFYDLATQRWLTPDPAGFFDGPNLYSFVHNNPLNRFDASGLSSDMPIRIDLPIAALSDPIDFTNVFSCAGTIGGMEVNWVVSCQFLDRIRPTSDELQTGVINLADHLAELTPDQGNSIGLLTYQNGINTPLKKFVRSCREIAAKASEGTLLIGLHHKTNGFFWDLLRLMKEISASETPLIQQTRQFMASFASRLHEINPQGLWGQILHSEGGAVVRRAIEGMADSCRDLLKQHLCIYALGPVLAIPEHYAHSAVNVYSKFDLFGLGGCLFGLGGYAMASNAYGSGDCRIELLSSGSRWFECSLWFIDHAFLGATYDNALDGQIAKWRERYGLYNGKIR